MNLQEMMDIDPQDKRIDVGVFILVYHPFVS
jgi:hypothetical protein